MKDLTIALDDRPGALAEMGAALGRAGISVEGGAAFVVDGRGIAHFLFADGAPAREALEDAGISVLDEREVLTQRHALGSPGPVHTALRATLPYVESPKDKRNVTLSLPAQDLRRARIMAARRGTSISGLLAETLRQLVDQDAGYTAARGRHLELMESGHDLGTGGNAPWTRGQLHER